MLKEKKKWKEVKDDVDKLLKEEISSIFSNFANYLIPLRCFRANTPTQIMNMTNQHNLRELTNIANGDIAVMPLQERVILSLEDGAEFEEITEILASPLGLVKELVNSSFSDNPQENLLKHEKKLDDIKKKIAGIASSHMMAGDYKIAKYSPYLFAFQQFFHSSYRARQGIPLEEVTYRSLNLGESTAIKSKSAKVAKVKQLFGIRTLNKDIDFLATSLRSLYCRYSNSHNNRL